MKRGQWSRWGRGMCEGYSLEIGPLLYGAVVKRETKGLPTTWMAAVNATALGEYLDRSEAMRRVEDWLVANMQMAAADWEIFKAAKAKRV
jgi:hypothetical protein